MCTAVTYRGDGLYFGRTLDLEYCYQESVCVAPRNYPFRLRDAEPMLRHHAIIGMAYVVDGYPLFYDGVNEKGLCIAGLNFPVSTRYFSPAPGWDNIAPYELIPWILGRCADVAQARELLGRIRLTDVSFRKDLPLTPLHWLIADAEGCIAVEGMEDGLRVYENPVGVLTNEPSFPVQMFYLSNYMGVSHLPPENCICPDAELLVYSRGMGGMGLPGDWSSQSRFVRAAFTRSYTLQGKSERESVAQFFHILSTVEQPEGCVELEDGRHVKSVYTSCCNARKGIYYYKTYEGSCMIGVDMHREDLEGNRVVSYPLRRDQNIPMEN